MQVKSRRVLFLSNCPAGQPRHRACGTSIPPSNAKKLTWKCFFGTHSLVHNNRHQRRWWRFQKVASMQKAKCTTSFWATCGRFLGPYEQPKRSILGFWTGPWAGLQRTKVSQIRETSVNVPKKVSVSSRRDARRCALVETKCTLFFENWRMYVAVCRFFCCSETESFLVFMKMQKN